jgi:hypothetical protein
MTPELRQELRARSAPIRERWETLLRIERVSGPLANPDALVHLIPHSLERLFKMLATPPRAALSLAVAWRAS